MTMANIGTAATGLDRRRTASPLYFGPEGGRLFGWFHHPAGTPRGPVLVVCPPLGYSMIMSHRGLRHLAEAASRQGMPSLRFDYHGTGDSSGTDEEPGRVDAWIDSVDHAIDEARRLSGAREVVLAGLRTGCLLGAYAASRRPDVAGLIAWAPISSGRAQVRELQAVERLASGYEAATGELPDGAMMAAGFMFSRETIERLRELDVRRLERSPAPRALVVPRDDLTDDDRFALALEHLGTDVTRASHPGFSEMMRDAHATQVPEEAIEGMVQWAGDGTRAAHVSEAPSPFPRGISPAGESLDFGASARITPGIEETTFLGRDGRLFGIITRPSGGAAPGRPAIILPSAGAVHRIGANRLHVTLARTWAERGFAVLRLDIGGIGDSLPFPGMPENESYSARAILDIAEAAEALKEEGGRGVVVAGMCSGAHAAFHAALELDGIAGIIMMNPIVFYWKPSDALEVSAWMTHKEVQRYQERVTRLDSWQRLLKGKVDLRHVARTLANWIGSRARARGRALLRDVAGGSSQPPGDEDIVRDLESISARGVDILLVFSLGEPGLSQLDSRRIDALARLRQLADFTYLEVPSPGHTFTSVRAQQTLLTSLTEHLTRVFPAGR